MKRLAYALFLVGLVCLATGVGNGTHVYPTYVSVQRGSPEGLVFGTNQDIHVNATQPFRPVEFSMYLVTWQDANETIVQNKSLSLLSPLFAAENITSFVDIVGIPSPGYYALVFVTDSDESLFMDVILTTLGVNNNVIVFGLGLMAAGAMVLLVTRFGLIPTS